MNADHDALVREWQQNAARREDSNFRFLRSLKMADDPDAVDALARAAHAEVFSRIDCTRCANCCKTMPPGLTDDDIARIAASLDLTSADFIARYLTMDRAEGGYLMKAVPCPFLGADDRCTIYEVRPADCRSYPNTDREGFSGRSYQHTSNTLTCPAVYHIVKEMRKRRRR
jgi:Fe-S-cluster containining protein